MLVVKKVQNRLGYFKKKRETRRKISSLKKIQDTGGYELTKIWETSPVSDHLYNVPRIQDKYTIFGYEISLADINWYKDYISGFEYPNERFDRIKISKWYDKGIDIKFPWEVSRFYFAVSLAQNYRVTGDEAYYIRFRDLVQDWIHNNPFLFGVNWYRAMEVAIRAVNWIVAVNLFGDRCMRDEIFYRSIVSSLEQHARYIDTFPEIKKNGTANNHLIADYFGLLFLAAALREHPEAGKWIRTSTEGLVHCINTQVNDDGTSFEGSIPYHRLVLEMFGYAAILCRANNIELPAVYYERLFTMFEFTAAYMDHNGNAPQIGDNDSGRSLVFHDSDEQDHSYLLDMGELLFDYDFNSQSKKRNPEFTQWLPELKKIDIDSLSLVPRHTDRTVYFSDGGYYFIKNENISILVRVVDVKEPVKKGHIHIDIGSIIVSYKGIPFIVDPGTYTYTRDLNQRKKYISDKSHNVLSVRNEEFGYTRVPGFFGVEIENRMNITQRSDTSITFNHDYYGEQIERSVFIEGDTVFIRDSGGNKLEFFLHLDPEVKVTELSKRKFVLKNGKYRAEIATSVPLTGENYEFSPGYGIRQKAERIISRGNNMLDIQFTFT